ncbi:MAG: hypothetical protein Q3966_07045 [Neisseria sp.]|nr:hypothetical protein [Neisseria sp.]
MKRYPAAAFLLLLCAQVSAAPAQTPGQRDVYALCGVLVRMDGSDQKTAGKVARFAAGKLNLSLPEAQKFLREGGMDAGIRFAAWYAGDRMLGRLDALPPLQTREAERTRRKWRAQLERIDAFYTATKHKQQLGKDDIPTAAFLEQAFALLEAEGVDVEQCISEE